MGAAQSTTAEQQQQPPAAPAPVVTAAAAAPAAAAAAAPQQRKAVGEASPPPAKLYRFVPDPRGRGGFWDLVDGAARPAFFDASEDSAVSSPARWFLEVGELSAPVSDEYSADAAERRVTMAVEVGEGEGDEEEEERRIRGGGSGSSAARNSSPSVFALRFSEAKAFRAFLDRYDEFVFQNTYGRPGGVEGRAAAFGEDSVLNLGLEGETAASAAAWVADDDEMPQAPSDEDEEEGGEDGDFDKTLPTAARVGGVPDGIRGLRLGAGERSYLVREGGRIEALRNVAGGVRPMEGGPVSFVLTPPAGGGGGGGRSTSRLRSSAAAAAVGGTSSSAASDLDDLTPGKMLLMRHETRLAALSASRPDRLLDADIETGKVVSEWSFQKDGVEVPMDDLANESRGAQLDGRSTFLGLASNRLVKWDMRTKEGIVEGSSARSPASPVVEWAGGKDYARGTRFSCLATAGDGSSVVGSADGQVRLFSDRSLTRAASSLPGLGAPVTSVDVTFDGKWALATTAKYLMVLKTSSLDSDGRIVSAFKQRMGRSAPAPRLLKLRPEDVSATKGAPLTKGKFTWVATPDAPRERWIAASCGTHTVLWSFDAVKRARAGGERGGGGGGASDDGGVAPTATLGGRGGGGLSSAGGLTTVPPTYLLSKGESVVDSVLMHDRFAAAGGGSGGGTPARGGTPPGAGGRLSTPAPGGRRGGLPPGRGTPGALAGAPGGGGGEHAAMVILTRQGIFSTAEGADDDY